MPLMKLRRAFRLATVKGHSVIFHPDTPTFVPTSIVADAVAIGAETVEGDVDVTPLPPPAANTGPADATLRENDLLAAINTVIARNDRDEFNAGGVPKPAAVAAIVGYKVDKREVTEVWMKRAELIVAGLLSPTGERV